MGPSAVYIVCADPDGVPSPNALRLIVMFAQDAQRGGGEFGAFFPFCVVQALAALHDTGLLSIILELIYLECN